MCVHAFVYVYLCVYVCGCIHISSAADYLYYLLQSATVSLVCSYIIYIACQPDKMFTVHFSITTAFFQLDISMCALLVFLEYFFIIFNTFSYMNSTYVIISEGLKPLHVAVLNQAK